MKTIKNQFTLSKPVKTMSRVSTTVLTIFLFSASTSVLAEKPYISEMPDTIGQGTHQLEYDADYTRPRYYPQGVEELSLTTHDLTYTYGLNDKIDLAINLPFDTLRFKNDYISALNQNDTDFQDLELSAKVAYYKSQALELGAKLTVRLPTGDETRINSARSAGRANTVLISANRLKLNPKLDVHHNFEFATNNRKGFKNNSLISNTLGATYYFNPHIAGIIDTGYTFDTRNSDNNARFATIGAQYIYQNTKIGAGFRVTREGNEISHSYNLGLQQAF